MRSKYGNRWTVYNGRKYQSRAEARRAQELDILIRAGAVESWTPQPRFKIEIKGERITTYRGDFLVLWTDGRRTVEDVKGVVTEVYKIKRALMRAVLGVEIVEVAAKRRMS